MKDWYVRSIDFVISIAAPRGNCLDRWLTVLTHGPSLKRRGVGTQYSAFTSEKAVVQISCRVQFGCIERVGFEVFSLDFGVIVVSETEADQDFLHSFHR